MVVLAYAASVALALAIVAAACAPLVRPLRAVLRELTGRERAARFLLREIVALLATCALFGSLLPPAWLDLQASSADRLFTNCARQLLGAGGALLVGLGATAALLLVHIARYERRRASDGA